MTEDEMKQTWCPHLRVAGEGLGIPAANAVVAPGGRGVILRSGFNCLGRGCSQWRWDDVPNPAYAEHIEKNRHVMLTYGMGASPPATLKSATDGHCGRAGPL